MLDLTSLAIGAAAIIALVVAWVRDRSKQFKRGREAAQSEANQNALDRTQKGRDAVARGRDGGTPAERLRRNEGRWQ